MAKAPFSASFVQHMVDVIEPLVKKMALIKDIQQPIIDFSGKKENADYFLN